MRFDQKATAVESYKLCSSLNSFWTRYFWNPASVKISANEIIIVAVTSTPKASGVSKRASTIVVMGRISFAANSVIADHFVAVMTCLFRLIVFK